MSYIWTVIAKLVIDMITQQAGTSGHDITPLLWLVAGTTAVEFVMMWLNTLSAKKLRIGFLVTRNSLVQERIAKTMTMQYEQLEDPDMLDRLQKAKRAVEGEWMGIGALMSNMWSTAVQLVAVITAVGIIFTFNGWLGLVLECGKANLRAMELLEAGNTGTFGTPVPTPVSLGRRKGKAILISGHDLPDLLALLEQTRDTGINVYTHGEMLPAHAYPLLHAFPHLAGHYGTAWQNQQKELPAFPGAVLFTTNCIQDPKDYADKVFTSGNVSWPGLVHCKGRDFSAVIRKALELPGFAEDVPGKEVLTGFGRETLLGAAPAVLDAVAQGKLRHIFLVGGCDGARPGRNYYTELVEKIPADCLILTLACGKFRFFDKELDSLGDIPRLLDVGQCNDAYAAVRVALALADALKCGVNDLPLSLVLSWYEQKAVSILLTLLALGVKNIRLGPTLPAFVSPNILKVLVEQWNIMPVTTPDEDLKAILG